MDTQELLCVAERVEEILDGARGHDRPLTADEAAEVNELFSAFDDVGADLLDEIVARLRAEPSQEAAR
jgi:hypothetical protein